MHVVIIYVIIIHVVIIHVVIIHVVIIYVIIIHVLIIYVIIIHVVIICKKNKMNLLIDCLASQQNTIFFVGSRELGVWGCGERTRGENFFFFCKMVVLDGLTETLNAIICMKQAEPL